MSIHALPMENMRILIMDFQIVLYSQNTGLGQNSIVIFLQVLKVRLASAICILDPEDPQIFFPVLSDIIMESIGSRFVRISHQIHLVHLSRQV